MIRPTQKEMILHILNNGETLTVLTALKRCGIYALSQRIGELRAEGNPIESRWHSYKTDWGESKKIKEYYVAQHATQQVIFK